MFKCVIPVIRTLSPNTCPLLCATVLNNILNQNSPFPMVSVLEFPWSLHCFQCHQIRWQTHRNIQSPLRDCLGISWEHCPRHACQRNNSVFIIIQLSYASSFQRPVFIACTQLMRKYFVAALPLPYLWFLASNLFSHCVVSEYYSLLYSLLMCKVL